MICDFISHFLQAHVPEIVPAIACVADLLMTQLLVLCQACIIFLLKVCDNHLKSWNYNEYLFGLILVKIQIKNVRFNGFCCSHRHVSNKYVSHLKEMIGFGLLCECLLRGQSCWFILYQKVRFRSFGTI